MVRMITQDRTPTTGDATPAWATALIDQSGPRADLKRCVTLPPNDRRCDNAWGHIIDFLPEHASEAEQRAFLAVAAMICDQPPKARSNTRSRSTQSPPATLGASMAYGIVNHRTSTVEAGRDRLKLLGHQNLNGLHRLLPSTIRHLRGNLVPIDWTRLITDLATWPRDHRDTATRWLQDYHRTVNRLTAERNTKTGTDSESEAL